MIIKKKKIPQFIIAVILCIYAVLGALIRFVFPSMLIYCLSILVVVGIVFLYGGLQKKHFKWDVVLLLSMAAVYLYDNYYLKIGEFATVGIYLTMLLLCYYASNKISWGHILLQLMKFAYFIYAVGTIAMFFMPNVYMQKIVPLFPETSVKLISWYKQGCMAGFTNHYSMNAMFLASGLIVMTAQLFVMKKKKTIDIINAGLMLIALLLTGKRGHIVFVASAIFALYYFYNVDNKKSRPVKIIGMLLTILCLGVITVTATPALGIFIFRFKEMLDSGDITTNRIIFWDLAQSLFVKEPIMGIGWGQFQLISKNTLNYAAHVHNVYFQLLCETGVLGFSIYIAWMVYMLRRAIKLYVTLRSHKLCVDKEIELAITYSVGFQIFFVLYCFTGNPLYDREMFIPYYLACAFAIYYSKFGVEKEETERSIMNIT